MNWAFFDLKKYARIVELACIYYGASINGLRNIIHGLTCSEHYAVYFSFP